MNSQFEKAAQILGNGMTAKEIRQTMGWYYDDNSFLYYSAEQLVTWMTNHLAESN